MSPPKKTQTNLIFSRLTEIGRVSVKMSPSQQDLCTFLISRACKNSTLANYLYW